MLDDDNLELERDIPDRLLMVENSLFLLKAKARYFPDWDNAEIERLERLRQDLRRRYDRSLAEDRRSTRRRFGSAEVSGARSGGADLRMGARASPSPRLPYARDVR